MTQATWTGMRSGSMPSGITWANYPLLGYTKGVGGLPRGPFPTR